MSENNWPMPQAGEVWQDWRFPEQTIEIISCDGFIAEGVYRNTKTGAEETRQFFVQRGCFVAMQHSYARIA